MTLVRIIKETELTTTAKYVDLSVDTSNSDQFKVRVYKSGNKVTIFQIQRYASEGSRLYLRAARKTKSRAEAERLAIEFLSQGDR